jgi:hypothetical protein
MPEEESEMEPLGVWRSAFRQRLLNDIKISPTFFSNFLIVNG